jgi:hypothetical protein
MAGASNSLKAIAEIKSLLLAAVAKKHCVDSVYAVEPHSKRSDVASMNYEESKDQTIARISKEIEAYAVAKYPQYDLLVVPVCHRQSNNDKARLSIDLKVRRFQIPQSIVDAKAKADEAYVHDISIVEGWYYMALHAISNGEPVPERPGL